MSCISIRFTLPSHQAQDLALGNLELCKQKYSHDPGGNEDTSPMYRFVWMKSPPCLTEASELQTCGRLNSHLEEWRQPAWPSILGASDWWDSPDCTDPPTVVFLSASVSPLRQCSIADRKDAGLCGKDSALLAPQTAWLYGNECVRLDQ